MSYNPNNPRPITNSQPLLQSNYSLKKRVQITFPEDSPYTKQSFKDECDINIILNRYMSTGELPVLNERSPQYLDVTASCNFQESMQYVAEAQSLFNELPSSIRNRFNNNPAEFLSFCSNEKNHRELAEMGLLKPQHEWRDPSIYSEKKATPEQNFVEKDEKKSPPSAGKKAVEKTDSQ